MASVPETRARPKRVQATAQFSVPRGKVPNAITASAARVGNMPIPNRGIRVPEWQLTSLAYYDQIGSVRYAAQFWARGLTKIRFFVGEKDAKGEITESSDAQAIEMFERIQDPMGGMVQITSAYGQLRFLAGECYLVWTPERGDDPESWEVVSVLEMRKNSKKRGKETWSRIAAPGLTPEELVEAEDDEFEPLGNEVIVYRMWKRHPAYSMMADAPMRSVISDCEEIVRCTHTINARLISRLSGPGIFAIPDSWKMKPLRQVATQSDAEAQQNPEADPFQTRLTQAMIAAIATPGSAESVAPIVVSVPVETTDKAHLYKIWDPNEVIRELETREKAIHRFAVGVDMPPGKVEGIEGSTHWNAWAIDKEGMEHLTPVATDFGNDIAGVYLRPALKQAGRADWAKFVVSFDPAEAVTNPDEFADAVVLFNNRAIGKKALRRSGNAKDTDAMTDEELKEALFVVTHQVVEVESGALVTDDGTTEEEPDDGEETETDMPEEPDEEDVVDEVDDSGDLSRMGFLVLGAAEVAIEEVRKTIGLRLRNHLSGGKHAELADQIKDVPAARIAVTLGPEVIETLAVDLNKWGFGAAAGFRSVVERQLACASQDAEAMQAVLELHAVRTVFETMPGLPAGFYGRVKALT